MNILGRYQGASWIWILQKAERKKIKFLNLKYLCSEFFKNDYPDFLDSYPGRDSNSYPGGDFDLDSGQDLIQARI